MWLYWMSSSNYSNEESYLSLLLYDAKINNVYFVVVTSNTLTFGDILGPDDMLDVQRTYVQALKTN